MKQAVVLNGNPKQKSFGNELVDTYLSELAGHMEIRRFNLSEMHFNPSLEDGYDKHQELESCLVEFNEAVAWANHIVIFLPVWWGGIPAKLKGLFDRAFLPGIAFKFEEGNPYPVQLLKGKTSRLIMTMDAPMEYSVEQATPVIEQLGRYTLEFCGIEKPEINLFGSVILSDVKERQQWLEAVRELGAAGL